MLVYAPLLRPVEAAGTQDRYGVARHLGTDSQTAGNMLWRARELGLVERRWVSVGVVEYHLTRLGKEQLAKSKRDK